MSMLGQNVRGSEQTGREKDKEGERENYTRRGGREWTGIVGEIIFIIPRRRRYRRRLYAS